MTRPRVLWVTAEAPDHELGGGNKRQAHLIEALAERADVHLLVAGVLRDPAVRDAVTAVTEVRVDPPLRQASRAARRLADLRWALFGGDAEELREHLSAREALAPMVRRCAADADIA